MDEDRNSVSSGSRERFDSEGEHISEIVSKELFNSASGNPVLSDATTGISDVASNDDGELQPLQELLPSAASEVLQERGQEDRTPRFDATELTQIILNSPQIVKSIKGFMSAGRKVHFIIPDNASGHVFLESDRIVEELEPMLFVSSTGDSPKGSLSLISLVEIPANICGSEVHVMDQSQLEEALSFPQNEAEKRKSILDYQPSENQVGKKYSILYTFSVNAEEIECKVHLVDALLIPGIYPASTSTSASIKGETFIRSMDTSSRVSMDSLTQTGQYVMPYSSGRSNVNCPLV